MRGQTRGGGRGGFSAGEPKACVTSAGFSKPAALKATATGAAIAPVMLKHLSTQPETEPQPSVFFSHGLPFGQQSAWAAVKEASCGMASAIPPAMGSRATASAIRVTRMCRQMLMLSATLCAWNTRVK
jgi:hypothetical protein